MMNRRWKWIVLCLTLLLAVWMASAVQSYPDADSFVYLPVLSRPWPEFWAKSAGTQYRFPEASYVDELQDGSHILIGKLQFVPWFAKVSREGTVLTSKSFDLLSNEDVSAARLSNGDYVVAGTLEVYRDGDYAEQLWLAKIDSLGQVLWQKSFPCAEEENAIGVAVGPNDHFYVATDRPKNNTGRVLKLNNAGEIQWSKTMDYQGDANGEAMTNTSDGGVLVAGVEWIGNIGMWSVKLDPAGDLVWKKSYHLLPYYYNDWGLESAAPAGAMGAVLAGDMTLSGSDAGFVLLIDDAGDIHWVRAYKDKNAKDQEFNYASQSGDGGLLIAGSIMPSSQTDMDVWLLKLTSSGDVAWQRRYGDEETNLGAAVTEHSAGSLLTLANAWGYFGTVEDFLWLLRLDSHGNVPGCGLGPLTTAATVETPNMAASASDITIGSGPVDVATATASVDSHGTVGSFLCPGTASAAICR